MVDALLDRAAIERMESAAQGGPVVLALSGGGASTALLHLMCAQLGAPRLQAIVIDHALRQGSAEDAERALSFAQNLGVKARIVTLEWAGGLAKSQAAARQARYRALCRAAHDVNARVIALGHTRDDQAETVFLRAASGSTWAGLAGMRAFAPAPVWPEGRDVWIARPLLGARRAALRTDLEARAAPWIEDPANANTAFARVRARAILARHERAGLDAMRFAALAEKLAPAADALDHDAAELIAGAARFEGSEIVLEKAAWRDGAAARQRALAVLVASSAGAPRPPTPEQVAALDAQIGQPSFKAATVGGALVQNRRGRLVLKRDSGALQGRADGAAPIAPVMLEAGKTTIWDGRVALTMASPGWRVTVVDGAPVLANGAARAPLAEAAPEWLLQARVEHLLARCLTGGKTS